MKQFILILCLALLARVITINTGSIKGKVTDITTGDPIIGATVRVVGTNFGNQTDGSGQFFIQKLAPGVYDFQVSYIGYHTTTFKGIKIEEGKTTFQNFSLSSQGVELKEVVIAVDKKLVEKSEAASSNIKTQNDIKPLPTRDINTASNLTAGVVPVSGLGTSIRGARFNETAYYLEGINNTSPKSMTQRTGISYDAVEEIMAQTGGISAEYGNSNSGVIRQTLKTGDISSSNITGNQGVNNNSFRIQQKEFNTEEYATIKENNFKDALQDPLSTFSIDVDPASYANVRRFLIHDQLPPKDAVRLEELINYFPYSYTYRNNGNPVNAHFEYVDCPWNPAHKLVLIGLKAKEIIKNEKAPSNLVFLIDVSGSMNEENKLPLVKRSFELLVNQLGENDKVAIVVYSGSATLWLPSTPCSMKSKILESIDALQAGGSTAGGEGMQLAYKIASENFLKEGNNRILWATDGDFNVGVSNTSDLVRMIEEKRKSGIFLSLFGYGMDNYKDSRLEELADKGNGVHAYIDNIMEAKKLMVDEVNGTLFTVAKDVKVQVEFNPVKIKSYRLLGYEDRLLNKEDFKDDKKDAGDMGSGHTVTALYEIVPNSDKEISSQQELKYTTTEVNKRAFNTDEVMTVKIRYKEPEQDKSQEMVEVLKGEAVSFSNASNDFKFITSVVEYGLLLRNSEYKGNSSFASLLKTAKASMGEDKYGLKAEFISLATKAAFLLRCDTGSSETASLIEGK